MRTDSSNVNNNHNMKTKILSLAIIMRVCQNVHILFFMHKAPTFSSQGFAIS